VIISSAPLWQPLQFLCHLKLLLLFFYCEVSLEKCATLKTQRCLSTGFLSQPIDLYSLDIIQQHNVLKIKKAAHFRS